MNKLAISDAIKKARKEVDGVTVEIKKEVSFQENCDLFPSETFKIANADWFDERVVGAFRAKSIVDWNKKDFLDFVKHLYFQKFACTPTIPPAHGYMYLNVIEEICVNNFPESQIKMLKARYISWYFENQILKDTIKYRTWNIKKMVHPKVVAAFIMHFSGSASDSVDSIKKSNRLPVNESLLELYFRGDAAEFIRCYGVIIPFAFLFYSKKFSWEDSLEYVAAAIADLVLSKNIKDTVLRKVTEQYGPYNSRFDKIAPERLFVALTDKTGVNFIGVKIK
jgi:hypothetical protein